MDSASPAAATAAAATAQSSEPAAAAPPASPLPPAAPAGPPAPMTYASLAKSWATVAADSGVAVGAPASASPSATSNGVATSNGGWGSAPDAAAVGGAGLLIEQPTGQPGSGMGHGSRPSSVTGKVSLSVRAAGCFCCCVMCVSFLRLCPARNVPRPTGVWRSFGREMKGLD